MLLTACTVLLVSCGQGAPATPAAELKIGEIDPITGVLAAQGTAVHQGITYAVDEVNAHGGVNGHKVRLVTRDDGGQPAEATTAAEDLLTKENVSALV